METKRLLASLVNAIKYIGWSSGVDPFSEFGDEGLALSIGDMIFGKGPAAEELRSEQQPLNASLAQGPSDESPKTTVNPCFIEEEDEDEEL